MTPDETWKLIEWYDRTRPVMIQHRDTGCEIEQFALSGMWVYANPDWLTHTAYRVKPQYSVKPNKPRLAYSAWFAGENGFTSAALKAVGLIDE